jgi:hypothetical protein
MRRAVFGEPLRAHVPEAGWIDARASTRLVEHQRDTGCDENCDGEQDGHEIRRRSPVIAPIVPGRAALVCSVVHICSRPRRRTMVSIVLYDRSIGASHTSVTG